ncbi:DNA ligase D [Lacipirellula limnantheis]|uniref:DNA ligase (ATP) n=1 Tax=Lacipirellula limnantheis TaxID=2528024 RepID=A0A517U1V7_9BACT|nr:DNA ligase D [Lacipirellula limnantheis]QDT74598.1 putative ATP-dependent DNA ligase YkoU [Lacipirellula limnantheis]
MSLVEYKRKRDFKRTPEPAGKRKASRGELLFVVQKHDASRLHYDFRLELDGTLKSWAVPKGPSLDPAVKSLAVRVEDHPLDYADFEGIIPAGEYGGGTVMLWDQGTWESEGDGDAIAQWRAGKLKFTLHGQKLKGSWALVRMGGRAGESGKNWLLVKHNDRYAKATDDFDVREQKQNSVVSNRTMEQIADASERVWGSKKDNAPKGKKDSAKKTRRMTSAESQAMSSPAAGSKSAGTSKPLTPAQIAKIPGAKKKGLPKEFQPQLATLVTRAPEGPDWIHELKFDGYRVLARVAAGKVQLITRNGHDWSHRFPSVVAAVKELPLASGIIDGEIVALNEQGVSDFQQLQNQLRRGDDRALAYYAFDLPFAQGYDLTGVGLLDRKRVLQSYVPDDASGVVRFSDHIAGSGETVWNQACGGGLEGIVCKRADGRYASGRGPGWVKVKCTRRQEFVIGGFSKPEGSRTGFGALLLGYYRGDELVYAGRVGAGFTHQSLRDVHRALLKRKRKTPAYDQPPTGADARGVTWVSPELVAEVAFTEWTDDGLLRHPSFQGLREDKSPKSIVREEPTLAIAGKITRMKRSTGKVNSKTIASRPQHPSARGRTSDEPIVAGVAISHPDRVVFPDCGVTKLDLARYYEQVADAILPHVVGRPLTLVRCPAGQSGKCFYQKHLTDSMPDTVHGVNVKENDGVDVYVAVDDLAGLISLVQLGVLEFHPWPAREDNVERPDRLVFDLDPDEQVSWSSVKQAAAEVRDCLKALGLESFLRTSGGKGLHVVAPIERRSDWDEVKSFAHGVADLIVRTAPDRYVSNMSKAKRRGKIFVDYLRNQRGATAVASYSTRARNGAPVATPLAWEELAKLASANAFTIENVPERLRRLRHDPWEGFASTRQSITAKARKLLQ